jgi:hypothetical protein
VRPMPKDENPLVKHHSKRKTKEGRWKADAQTFRSEDPQHSRSDERLAIQYPTNGKPPPPKHVSAPGPPPTNWWESWADIRDPALRRRRKRTPPAPMPEESERVDRGGFTEPQWTVLMAIGAGENWQALADLRQGPTMNLWAAFDLTDGGAHGQREIARITGVPLTTVHDSVARISALFRLSGDEATVSGIRSFVRETLRNRI